LHEALRILLILKSGSYSTGYEPRHKMASESKTAIVPLNDSNYSTWKVQCRMALMKDGLWGIVTGTERCPDQAADGDAYIKFVARRDRALAIVVLSIEPSLLYLIGDPEDPVVVWKKLSDQFQKKTWANKLALRRKLYSLRLRDGSSVQEHIKEMTEIFDGLSVIGDPIEEEDRVVHLLASLPSSYSILVTALEANPEVPKMEIVTERLLHEEQKQKKRVGPGAGNEEAMAFKHHGYKGKGPRCHFCRKFGHIQRNCPERTQGEVPRNKKPTERKSYLKHKANNVEVKCNSSDSENDDTSEVCHALLAGASENQYSWIVDSGATCHTCNDSDLFTEFQDLRKPTEVALGDGHTLSATGRGVVLLTMRSQNGEVMSSKCKLHNVLYVPGLSYNLLSVSKATEKGATIKFDRSTCQFFDENNKPFAVANKKGSLYHLDCNVDCQQVNAIQAQNMENIWHRRYGHIGIQNLKRLANDKLVNGFNFDVSKEIDICEACIEGKHHRSKFPTSIKQAEEPLELVHSDVCGKINVPSLGGAEYFLTFIDDKSRYVWVYFLKQKSEVFERFLEWKAQVENESNRQLKILRSDNGGEYRSAIFEKYLKREGVKQEFTVPKTPEQNGVAERMNRTLIETVRSMLADSKLPQKFWAEALSTAVYLRNRSPTKAVQGMTPFESWTGEKADVKHFRVFRCVAYSHITKDERKKLYSKVFSWVIAPLRKDTGFIIRSD
jgi:transposase InsO family protein